MPIVRPDHLDDPVLDDYRSLRGRERDDALYAEGPTVVDRLLASSLDVRSVLLSTAAYERFGAQVAERVGESVPVIVVDRETLRGVVGFDLHRGAIALADRPADLDPADVLVDARLVVALEGINDHENLGAIARSALGLGADALLLDPTCADPWYRRSVRVSMGALLHLPVARALDWSGTLESLAGSGWEVWALTPAADADDVRALDVPARLVVLAGAEGPGLSPATLARWRHVGLPMRGDVDSLNVGHAVAATLAIVGRSRP